MKSSNTFKITALILVIISVGLLLYPTASQVINKMFDKNSIVIYNNQVSVLDDTSKNHLIKQAQEYNKNLSNVVTIDDAFTPNAFKIDQQYEKILNITDDGLMGTVVIPNINCNLPIYHGTSEELLDKGAVHMANTSFPIGGEDTHAVISAHTAYPGKEFFNKLVDVKIGDNFYIKVLDKTFAYKVCRIDVVLPSDSRLLRIENGQDLVTLVTCTPYSVNTHRLLVRGERDLKEEQRIKNANIDVTNETDISKTILIISIVIVPVAFIAIILIIKIKRKEKNSDQKD